MIKYLYILILIIPLLSSQQREGRGHVYNLLDSASYIRINGETNVNEFQCSYFNDCLRQLPNCNILRKEGKLESIEALIEIPISEFDCGNILMNKDFQNLLKEENFPHIIINIDQLKETLSKKDKNRSGEAEIRINIAGKSRNYKVEYLYEKGRSGFVTIKGKKKVDILDFGLTPPTKFMGLVKTHNHVLIDFEFKLSSN